MKQPLIRSILFLLWPVMTCPAGEPAEARLKLVSWNINRLGRHGYHRDTGDVADFLAGLDADLICIQEIDGGNRGKTAFRRLMSRLNQISRERGQSAYHGYLGPAEAGERGAFMWRDPVIVRLDPSPAADPDSGGAGLFKVTPLFMEFEWNGRTWDLLNVHCFSQVESRSGRRRDREFLWLRAWLEERKEIPALIMGDFNRFTGGREPWAVFEAPAPFYRFPLLDAIGKRFPGFDEPGSEPERLLGTQPLLRDQIAVTPPVWPYLGHCEWETDVGIRVFENHSPLSDHFPVWIILRQ